MDTFFADAFLFFLGVSSSFLSGAYVFFRLLAYFSVPCIFFFLIVCIEWSVFRWAGFWLILGYFYLFAYTLGFQYHPWLVFWLGLDVTGVEMLKFLTQQVVFGLAAIASLYLWLKHTFSCRFHLDRLLTKLGASDRLETYLGDSWSPERYLGYIGLLCALFFGVQTALPYGHILLDEFTFGERTLGLSSVNMILFFAWVVYVLSVEAIRHKVYFFVPALVGVFCFSLYQWVDSPLSTTTDLPDYQADYDEAYIDPFSWWLESFWGVKDYRDRYMGFTHSSVDDYSVELARINVYLLEEIESFNKDMLVSFSPDPDDYAFSLNRRRGPMLLGQRTPVNNVTQRHCELLDRLWPFDPSYSELRKISRPASMYPGNEHNWYWRSQASERINWDLGDGVRTNRYSRLYRAKRQNPYEKMAEMAARIPLPGARMIAAAARAKLKKEKKDRVAEFAFCGRTLLLSEHAEGLLDGLDLKDGYLWLSVSPYNFWAVQIRRARIAGDITYGQYDHNSSRWVKETMVRFVTKSHPDSSRVIDRYVSGVAVRGDLSDEENIKLKALFRQYLTRVSAEAKDHADSSFGHFSAL